MPGMPGMMPPGFAPMGHFDPSTFPQPRAFVYDRFVKEPALARKVRDATTLSARVCSRATISFHPPSVISLFPLLSFSCR